MFIVSPPILVLAVLWLDLALGPIRFALRSIPAPPVVMGRLARGLSRRLDRPNRSDRTLKARGAVLGILLCASAVVVGWEIHALGTRLLPRWAPAIEAFVFWGFLRGHLPLARLREGLRHIGNDDRSSTAARALLEQTAVSFVHFVIAPIFWFLLTGLPGVFAAAAAWAIDRAAREGGSHKPFGAFARAFEYLLIWIPVRIAELVLAFAAGLVPRGRPLVALKQGWNNVALGQYGAVAALAGGLGVVLPSPSAGPPDRRWLGDGTARIGRNDVLRATWLYAVALLIISGLLILLALAERSAGIG